jgi:hypothetical protein
MAIDRSKILTISASEWFEMTGEDARHYEPRGVHCEDVTRDISEGFASKVPSSAKVVVNYRHSSSSFGSSSSISPRTYASGTALIEKNPYSGRGGESGIDFDKMNG